jgi:pyruvate/2-oxoglutarate dehydrogenase complex dihydrolipoamide dehydrogenase (E3) component
MTLGVHYDAIIISAGYAGGPLSTALAHAGWKTALIERSLVGGTCINEGCTPTKAMVASARVHGLEHFEEMLRHLTEDKEAIKVYIEVAQAM